MLQQILRKKGLELILKPFLIFARPTDNLIKNRRNLSQPFYSFRYLDHRHHRFGEFRSFLFNFCRRLIQCCEIIGFR